MKHLSTSSGDAVPVSRLDHQQQLRQIVVIPIPQPVVPPSVLPPPEPKVPCLDLLKEESREEYIKIGVPLYEAAIKGDWKAAAPILDNNPNLIRFAITENHETLLHIATSTESTKAVEYFVKNVVELMDKNDLELQNNTHDTALNLAAVAGNIATAKIMLEKNKSLSEIPNKNRLMPLCMAALFAKHDMVRYLYGISKKMSGKFWTCDNRGFVLQKCVEADIFDVAIKIVNDCPELTSEKGLLTSILLALAQKPYAFKEKKPDFVKFGVKLWSSEKESEALQLLKIIWEKIAKRCKSEIDEIILGPPLKENGTIKDHPSRVLFIATKMGNTSFITELIRLYPDVILKVDDKKRTIFHIAIKRRHAEIYNLLYEIGVRKDFITTIEDDEGNNMLHMFSKGSKPSRSSRIISQLQQDLLWFKEVEKMIPPQYRQRKNKVGETPKDLFTKHHADMVNKIEDWIKKTASQWMLVATLIATITFAAAFTLPGGYNQNTGIPFFCNEPALVIFVISDAISFIFSSTSILTLLYIVSSRFDEVDILFSLPKRLGRGFLMIFLSITSMMVAFAASFFVLYSEKVKWVPVTIAYLAGMPVIIFSVLQFRLQMDIFSSSYRSRGYFKTKKRVLYY